MNAIIEISEELERKVKEATKALEEEVDNYHEHSEHQRLQIDEVVCEGEEIDSSKGDEDIDARPKYIIEEFDADLEEKFTR